MQGVILSAGSAQGLILGDDGARYTFTPLGWRDSSAGPAVGMRVEFEARGAHAVGIVPIAGATPRPSAPQQFSAPAAAPGASPAQPEPAPPAAGSNAPAQPPSQPPARRGFGSRWWHWALAGGGALAVALVIVGGFVLGFFGTSGPPMGREVARHTHEGRTYVLVEYGNELAIFSDSGAPVGERGLAEDILRSYAWRQVIADFDIEELKAVSQRVQRLDDSVSDARRASNGMVWIFDELDDMEANIPLLGSVSAMDVVRESFAGVTEAEDLIRSLDSELNDLGRNAASLTEASARISSVNLSSVSGEEMEGLFTGASEAARDLEGSAGTARESVSQVREAVGDLAAALRAGSDTPLIGGALADFAQSADSFESELSGLSGLLGGVEANLGTLGQDLEGALESADSALRADMERWLAEPYDAQWPPADAEQSSSAIGSQPTSLPGQGAEPATVAPPDDGGSETGDRAADYERVYQAAYEEAYSQKYNQVFDDARERFGETLTERQRRTTERNARRRAERYAPAYAEKYAEGRSIPFAEYYAELIAGGASPEYAAAYTEVYVATGSKSDAYEFANRIKDGELKEYSIERDAGKSHKYAFAFAEQIDGGKSEEYADAYAQQIDDGSSEEYADAYAWQIRNGKSEEYAATYAQQIDDGKSGGYAAIYAQQIEDGKSEEYAATYAHQVAPRRFKLEWETSATSVDAGRGFTLTVRMYGVHFEGEHGGISVSFPTLAKSGEYGNDEYSYRSTVVQLRDYTSGRSNVTFHQPGATIYHRENNRQFPAEYLLVESDDPSWSRSDDRTLKLSISPGSVGEFPIQIRGWLCADGYAYCTRNPDSGPVTDQQGWVVTEVSIEVTGTSIEGASIDEIASFSSISAGYSHTCGLGQNGFVGCGGSNEYGQATPPEGEFSSVSAGYGHTCGVRRDGLVECWGSNYVGQATPPEGEFSSVAAGYFHTCGVRRDGLVECWGSNDYGRAIPPEGEFSSVSAGGAHTCGVRRDGSAVCWGSNGVGQATPPEGEFSSVSAGGAHTCGVRRDSSAVCWGEDYSGQATPPEGEFSSVSVGDVHTCGVKRDGFAVCWGDDEYGQVTSPEGEFSSVSAGGLHTCGVRQDGSAVCWGDN